MEGLSVKKLSAKSLAKLKRGHKVRLMKGEGTTICVSPENFNSITRSFARGKGINMSMSPEEIAHNHGKGFFDSIKKGVSKVGKVLAPIAEKVGKVALDKATEHGTKYVEKQIDKHLAGEGMRPSQRAGAIDTDIINKINDLTGQKLGALAKSNLVQSGARMLRSNMERAFTQGLHSIPTGHGLYASGLYASPSGGEGLHPRHHLAHHHRKMIERSSIGASGNLLGMPPALMSQPYSANFQFASRLPPAYANMIKNGGSGLY